MTDVPNEARPIRCAIYTRKSTSFGLDAPLNSLQTQRDVCRAYIQCQAHRDWIEVPEQYDDGGYSGGTLERPALHRLIKDVEAGLIDVIVIYKIDRLSRSLADFVRLIELLGKHQTSFVSVTQAFDTSDSMGRLVLNILLTFAQFERELACERIRDRIAEKRRRGHFCGGRPPIGYLVRKSGQLVPDPARVEIVRSLFIEIQEVSISELARRLIEQGFVTAKYVSRKGRVWGATPIDESRVGKLLRNPIYAGYFLEGGELKKCDIQPIVTLEEWQSAQRILATRNPHVHDPVRNFLLGILMDEQGRNFRISQHFGKRRRYVSNHSQWSGGTTKIKVEANRVEQLAISALKAFLVDQVILKRAVLSLGSYSKETAKILRRGKMAARRISRMSREQLREAVLALIARAEVAATELRLFIDCYELTRFLAWDGSGLFRRCEPRPQGADRFRLVYAPAFLIQKSALAAIPLKPCKEVDTQVDSALVALLDDAIECRRLAFENRTLSMAQIGNGRKMSARQFARMMRITYLAPDIQAAIVDGTQPDTLTRNKLLFGSLPLDWEQQRQLLGFPDPLAAEPG